MQTLRESQRTDIVLHEDEFLKAKTQTQLQKFTEAAVSVALKMKPILIVFPGNQLEFETAFDVKVKTLTLPDTDQGAVVVPELQTPFIYRNSKLKQAYLENSVCVGIIHAQHYGWHKNLEVRYGLPIELKNLRDLEKLRDKLIS